MATSGIVAGLYAPTAASVTMTNEATTDSGTQTRYTITNAAKRYIDPESAVTVKVNGTPVTSGFTIEYAGGAVVFATALAGGDTVTVSGKYYALSEVGGIKSYKVGSEAAMLDATDFLSGGWKQFVAGEKSWTADAEGYWLGSAWSARVGTVVVVSFYLDKGASKRRLDGVCFVTGDDLTADSGELITEAVKFQGHGPLSYREG